MQNQKGLFLVQLVLSFWEGMALRMYCQSFPLPHVNMALSLDPGSCSYTRVGLRKGNMTVLRQALTSQSEPKLFDACFGREECDSLKH